MLLTIVGSDLEQNRLLIVFTRQSKKYHIIMAVVPIVDLTCQFKQPLSFGEEAIVETRFIHSDAAKILFEYTIYRASDQNIVATGTTTQVFLNTNRELELVNPAFYIEWKKKWNII